MHREPEEGAAQGGQPAGQQPHVRMTGTRRCPMTRPGHGCPTPPGSPCPCGSAGASRPRPPARAGQHGDDRVTRRDGDRAPMPLLLDRVIAIRLRRGSEEHQEDFSLPVAGGSSLPDVGAVPGSGDGNSGHGRAIRGTQRSVNRLALGMSACRGQQHPQRQRRDPPVHTAPSFTAARGSLSRRNPRRRNPRRRSLRRRSPRRRNRRRRNRRHRRQRWRGVRVPRRAGTR